MREAVPTYENRGFWLCVLSMVLILPFLFRFFATTRYNFIESFNTISMDNTHQIHDSPGYAIALEQIRKRINNLELNRSRPRSFSLHGIQKEIEAPMTADGFIRTREITQAVLTDLVEDGSIVSFVIKPNFANGPEWAFVELPKKPRKKRSCPTVEPA